MIGNKTDLDRQVTAEEVNAWRAQNGNPPYIETCATQGTKIEDAFRQLAETALEKQTSAPAGFDMPTSLSAASGAQPVVLNPKDDQKRTETVQKKKKKCGC